MSDKNLCGRPPFEPTIIAKVVGCNRKTLRKHFRSELRDGREMLIARMGLVVVRCGLAGDWRAAAYWLLRFGGPQWRLPPRVTLTGSLSVMRASDVTKMTDEEIARELTELNRKEAALADTRVKVTGCIEGRRSLMVRGMLDHA